MKSYVPSFADRRERAIEARKALLARFTARPDPNDPAVLARAAERQAVQTARAVRAAERAAAKEASDRAAEAEAAERIEREAVAQAEAKAQRDARYAARKARKS